MELVEGRPQDKRIDKEERVYDLLDQLYDGNMFRNRKNTKINNL